MKRWFVLLFIASAALAQNIVPWSNPAQVRPPILARVNFEQKLGDQIPLELTFRDDAGRTVRLADYFGKRPVVLQMVYYECPMLCTEALNGTLRAFRATNFNAGREFESVTVSINPRETPKLAASKKASYVEKYGRPGAAGGWHFLTGDEPQIRALADAIGFRYAYDAKSGQYAHTTGIVVATPQGRIARYQYGVEYSARDLKYSVIEASGGKIGTRVDQLLLFCFHYDPSTGKYTTAIMNLLRAASIAVFIALGVFVVFTVRRDRGTPAGEGRA